MYVAYYLRFIREVTGYSIAASLYIHGMEI
jgi:hypothetical protein